MNLPKIKLYVIIIISIAAIAFLYRILADETVSSATMTGLIIVLALLFLTLLSDRITEFSAGIKDVSAKLEDVEKGDAPDRQKFIDFASGKTWQAAATQFRKLMDTTLEQ